MKRLLKIFLLLYLLPLFANGQIAFVASSSTKTTSTNVTAALNSTGANLLIATVATYTVAATGTLTDNASNTWHLASRNNGTTGNGQRMEVFYAWGTISTSATHTCSYTTGGFPSVNFYAFSGALSATDPLDVITTATGTITSMAAGSVTPSQTNEMCFVGANLNQGTTPDASVNSGYTGTISVPYNAGVNFCQVTSYIIQTSIITENPTITFPTATTLASSVHGCFKSLAGTNTSDDGFFLLIRQ